MKENRETEFAFIFGQMMGFFSDPATVQYMRDNGVTPMDIKAISVILGDIASKVFYGNR